MSLHWQKKIPSWPLWTIVTLSTLFWAIHPMRVEAVAWAINRKGLLSSLFFLSSILCYLHITKKNTLKILGYTTLLGIMALASHPNTLILPLLLILLDIYPLKRTNTSQLGPPLTKITNVIKTFGLRIIEKVPLIICATSISILTMISQRNIAAIANTNILTTINNASYQLWFYIKETLINLNQAPIYSPINFNKPTPLIISIFLGLTLLTYYCYKNVSNKPYLSILGLCYIICLLPTLGIIQAGWITHADRWSYLASIPVIIFITGLLLRYRKSNLILLAFIGLLLTQTYFQQQKLKLWKDNLSMFTYLYTHNPQNNLFFKIKYAQALIEQNKLSKAKQILIKERTTKNKHLKEAIYHFLYKISEKEHNTANIIFYLQKCITLNPLSHLNIERLEKLTIYYKQQNNPQQATESQQKLHILLPRIKERYKNNPTIHITPQSNRKNSMFKHPYTGNIYSTQVKSENKQVVEKM
ncbi:MAG: hypothetical protein VW378_03665 [bacterium]